MDCNQKQRERIPFPVDDISDLVGESNDSINIPEIISLSLSSSPIFPEVPLSSLLDFLKSSFFLEITDRVKEAISHDTFYYVQKCHHPVDPIALKSIFRCFRMFDYVMHSKLPKFLPK